VAIFLFAFVRRLLCLCDMKLLQRALAVLVLLTTSSLHASPEKEMTDAAQKFGDALTPEQRSKAVYELNDNERFNWHFVPKARNGLPLKEMTGEQKKLAHTLLKSALSASGYTKVTNVISLETILFELENKSPTRDTGLYYVSIFGSPQKKDWGWRFEGHHLALNFFVCAGKLVSITPTFLGANPAEIPGGPRKGLRILAGEEDMARDLAKSFSEEQRKIGIFTNVAPREIITGNSRKARFLEPAGINWTQLNKDQQKTFTKLIHEYVLRYQHDIANAAMNRILRHLDKVSFAWAGELEPGEGHYYRIQGPTFLIEYDNTQNKAKHVHCVWRDLENDFGDDALAKHYQQEHR
jgi:hypothetical protein